MGIIQELFHNLIPECRHARASPWYVDMTGEHGEVIRRFHYDYCPDCGLTNDITPKQFLENGGTYK